MRLLLIGGNGFIGRFVAANLQKQGHEIAILHRGTGCMPAGVGEIVGDRHDLQASAAALKRFQPDIVVDFVISSGAQAEGLMKSSGARRTAS
jgi:nucleoside-diphosphate-sugar epimerase